MLNSCGIFRNSGGNFLGRSYPTLEFIIICFYEVIQASYSVGWDNSSGQRWGPVDCGRWSLCKFADCVHSKAHHNYTRRKTANRKNCCCFTYQALKSKSFKIPEQNEQLTVITRVVLCYLYCKTVSFIFKNNGVCCTLKENRNIYNLKLQLETIVKYSAVSEFYKNCSKTSPPALYPLYVRSMHSKESHMLNTSY